MDVYFELNGFKVDPCCPLHKAVNASDCFGKLISVKCKFFDHFCIDSLDPYTCHVSCKFSHDSQLFINFIDYL